MKLTNVRDGLFVLVMLVLCMGLVLGPLSAWEAWKKENWTGVVIGAVWFSSFFVVPFILSNRTAGKIVKFGFTALLAGLVLSRPFAILCAKACGVLCVAALFAGWQKTSMRLAAGAAVCVLFWWLCQRLAVTCRRGCGRPR